MVFPGIEILHRMRGKPRGRRRAGAGAPPCARARGPLPPSRRREAAAGVGAGGQRGGEESRPASHPNSRPVARLVALARPPAASETRTWGGGGGVSGKRKDRRVEVLSEGGDARPSWARGGGRCGPTLTPYYNPAVGRRVRHRYLGAAEDAHDVTSGAHDPPHERRPAGPLTDGPEVVRGGLEGGWTRPSRSV